MGDAHDHSFVLRGITIEEARAENPGLSEETLKFLAYRYPDQGKNEIPSLVAVLNQGSRGNYSDTFDPVAWIHLKEVARRIREREIEVSAEDIEAVTPHPLRLFSGRSEEHKAYCSAAAHWVDTKWNRGAYRDLGESWSHPWVSDHVCREACRYPRGGFADLVSSDQSLYVECGFLTTPEKVLNGIEGGAAVLVIPYRDTIKSNHARGFLFKAGPACTAEVLKGYQKKRLADMYRAAEGVAP